MEKTLLSTKLNAPPFRQALVHRAGLLAALQKAGTVPLTLISAPPGYGKTTLVSSWLAQAQMPFAWLSLDEGDNDPIRFLEYFLNALHKVVPSVRREMLTLLQGPQAASYNNLMAILSNEAGGASDFCLVMDDFHVLHSAPILDMLGYLVEHIPPAMHLVLMARSDPALRLARLRARGQLLELRADQLRFSTGESGDFLRDCMGLKLNPDDLAAIAARTEGWIAGLQLAGLAMQSLSGQAGTRLHAFVSAFSGSHAYIMDYLTDEVLRVQPEALRTFLLQTSILERMCGPLCDALVQASPDETRDGQSLLESVEQKHLFVIPLDGERRWFRYHHLFREVLSRRLESQAPRQVVELHRRASTWFRAHGFIPEAIQHALKSGDLEWAAHLVEKHGCDLLMAGEVVTLGEWLAAIDAYTHTRPWLAMQKAWVLALSGQVELAARAIDAGEQLLSTFEPSDEIRTLRGSLVAAKAQWANFQRKTDLAADYARQALEILSFSDDFSCALRSVATSLLGDSSWVEGRMAEARKAYGDAVRIGQIAKNPHMTMLSLTNQANVCFDQGQLYEAHRLYAETLRMADELAEPESSYAQSAQFGLSRVYYTQNRLDEAAAASQECLHLSRHWANLDLQAACFAFSALIERARGDVEKACQAAAAAEELLRGQPFSPDWSLRVRTGLAHFWLHQGSYERALFLIQEEGVLPKSSTLDTIHTAELPQDEIPYRLEAVYLILARLFLELGRPEAVLRLGGRLLQGAKAGGRGRTTLELQLVQAMAQAALKDTSAALAALDAAIALGWPENAARPFLDEGERMTKLLYQARAHHIGGEFVEGLLAWAELAAGVERSPARPKQDLLMEPLSARELEVLKCIAEGCSNQEIAGRFVLSPKTVKRHISNIYSKLDAKNRTQAVALARSLNLID